MCNKWKLADSSNILVGYFFVEDGVMKIEDLKGNQYKAPAKTTLRQAVRIILHYQQMIC